jgi:dihydroorotate dehydrogenase
MNVLECEAFPSMCRFVQVYHGPALIPKIKRDLLLCLQKDGFRTIEEAVGADHR